MVELNLGGFFAPPSIVGVSRTQSKIGLNRGEHVMAALLDVKNILNRTQNSPPPKLQLSNSLQLKHPTVKTTIWSLEDFI